MISGQMKDLRQTAGVFPSSSAVSLIAEATHPLTSRLFPFGLTPRRARAQAQVRVPAHVRKNLALKIFARGLGLLPVLAPSRVLALARTETNAKSKDGWPQQLMRPRNCWGIRPQFAASLSFALRSLVPSRREKLSNITLKRRRI